MRPAEIECRLCGHHYGESDGCVTCQPAKANIIWPAMGADSSVDLLAMSNKSIKLLELSLDRLEREMTESVGGRSGHYYAPHAKEACQLGRTLSFMLAEARKLEDRDASLVKNMTFSQKVELFMEFLAELPPEFQHQVAERVVGLLGPGEDAEVVE